MAELDHGFLLKKGTTSIGTIINITPPSISTERVDTTNHASTSRAYIGDALPSIGEFDVTLEYDYENIALIITDIKASTVATYSIEYPNGDKWSFSAFPRVFKPEASDGQKVNILRGTVTFSPSGDLTTTKTV